MSNTLHVLLVNDPHVPAPAPSLVRGLQQADCVVHLCDSLAQLRQLIDEAMPDAMVVRTAPAARYRSVVQARAWAPAAALVIMLDGSSAEARIAAIDAGADACCALFTQAAEVGAMLRAALRYRHLATRPSQWRLLARDRMLAGPGDRWLPLTLTEGRFLRRMLESPGWLMPRADPIHGGRALDVTVSRLRAKAAELGIDLPLFTVRDWGYMFLADRAGPGT